MCVFVFVIFVCIFVCLFLCVGSVSMWLCGCDVCCECVVCCIVCVDFG